MPISLTNDGSIVSLSPFDKLAPSVVRAPPVELKKFPDDLKYIFLGPKETLPVIISSNLTEEEEGRLFQVLVEHKEAIGWTIATS